MAIPQSRSKGKSDTTDSSLTDGLVEEILIYYIDWRHDAAAAADAYRRWSTAPADEAVLRFSAYMAALEQEEFSATAYAIVAREAERALQCDQSVSASV